MPIGSVLSHRVSVVTRVAVLDDEGEPLLDDDGQYVTAEQVREIAADIQPKSGKEVTAPHQAGAAISTHTIYTTDLDVRPSDAIEHDPETCPRQPRDLPFWRFELEFNGDAAGRGHHLEIDARLIAPTVPVTPAGSGSAGSGS
jgi:hypothetical protein